MKKRQLTIGLCGLEFSSDNKGCVALAHSFVMLLKDAATNQQYDLNLVIIQNVGACIRDIQVDSVINNIEVVGYQLTDFRRNYTAVEALKKCDVVFDFTEGDSFTDIYGIKRFIVKSYLKETCILKSIPLVLCPQTYGPYNSYIARRVAGHILKHAYRIYARDKMSLECVKDIAGKEATMYMDVAFSLPHEKFQLENNTKIKVGINVSALLWNYGVSDLKAKDVRVNYQQYIRALLEYLLIENRKYEVHLIPHVICNSYNDNENDLKILNILKEEYEEIIVVSEYNTPMQLKGYISSMDIFTGARMHSTIAAFSRGVATIPFSYSRKFEGLYETLEYPYYIDGKKETTQTAIERTICYIENYLELKNCVKEKASIAKSSIREFTTELEEILSSL